MLPLYLSIEGLYSYQNKQEIDFTQLTEAGLFGIFGSVGSGKSSVLEAISFALYGETERLNKQEKRSYNMMNLKSNHTVIDFQFLNFENKKYRFVAQWKRKKKFEDTTGFERYAYEWKNDSWLPLESADGALVTNLTYPNFRRTIIIPQGQFKEFLELKGKERSDMMKEIFFLNQYDLGPKVSYMLSDTNKKIEHLKGVLSGYEEVNADVLEEKNKQFETVTLSLAQAKKEYDELEAIFQKLEQAKQLRYDLRTKEEELAVLEVKKAQIQKLENQIAEYELVTTNFKEHINNFSSIAASKNALLIKIESLKETKDKLKAQIIQAEADLEKAIAAYQGLDNLKAEIEDLKLLSQNIDTKQTIQEKEIRIQKGQTFLTAQQKEEAQRSQELLLLEEDFIKLKSRKINSSELLTIDSWYQKNEQLSQKIKEEKARINIIQDTIQELQNKFNSLGFTSANWKEELEAKQTRLDDSQKVLLQHESDLRLKQELGQYIHNLHEGEACPLCGSVEHPAPMHVQDVDNDFATLHQEKQQLIVEQNKLSIQKDELSLAARLIAEKTIEQKTFEQALDQIVNDQNTHQQAFDWQEFDKDNREAFEVQKNALFQLEKDIDRKEKQIAESREILQKTKDTIQKSERVLQELVHEVKVLEAHIAQNTALIRVIKISDYQDSTREALIQKSSEITASILKIENDYTRLSQSVLELKTSYAQIKGQHTEAQEQYVQWTAKLQELQTILNNLLIEFDYPDVATINEILSKNLNTVEGKQIIQQFYLDYTSIANRINEIKAQTQEDQYSEELYEAQSVRMAEKKGLLEELLSTLGAIKEELEKLTVDLAKKKELLDQFTQLDNRRANLKLLDNMFKGNGFVNYVSSIHLERLCELANQRFHRLTKNQLSLVINESNEFEVIDFLNNGYRRSVKTLSGGQGFQASLCLALALAENIQSLNKADKNFFFIDEGFGTQDTESINTVFDTLQYLHQENRVVGIISHVEELKERMPRAITVVKDVEKGSIIQSTI